MFQVGVSIGGGEDFKELLRGFRPKMLLIPLATIGGTAVFGIGQCAADSLECVRLFGCGQRTGVLFAFVHPDYGTQNPRPWCTVGYGTGHDCTSDECHPRAGGTGGSSFHLQILREAGSYSVAGVTSVDVALPSIIRVSGKEMVPLAIFHGLLVDMSVPFFISLFCKL